MTRLLYRGVLICTAWVLVQCGFLCAYVNRGLLLPAVLWLYKRATLLSGPSGISHTMPPPFVRSPLVGYTPTRKDLECAAMVDVYDSPIYVDHELAIVVPQPSESRQ